MKLPKWVYDREHDLISVRVKAPRGPRGPNKASLNKKMRVKRRHWDRLSAGARRWENIASYYGYIFEDDANRKININVRYEIFF